MPVTDYSSIDIYELLRSRRMIATIWSAEDVLTVRPDLPANQAWEVLLECDRRQDCEVGMNWDFIELTADELFPSGNE